MEVRIIKCGSLEDLMSVLSLENEMGEEIKAMMDKENTSEEKKKDVTQTEDHCTSDTAEISQTPCGKGEQASCASAQDAEMTKEALRKRNENLTRMLREARDEITKLCVEKADLKSRIRSLEDYAMRVERITDTSPLLKERRAASQLENRNETAPRTI